MKPAAQTSITQIPTMCDTSDSDYDDCTSNPLTWARRSWTSKTSYGGDVGLARDGHVIVGPYNSSGETWDCDEHDICNGTFLSDGSYAYVATKTFPYIVGCWGPSEEQKHYVPSSCSTTGCGAVAGLSFMLGTLALAVNLYAF